MKISTKCLLWRPEFVCWGYKCEKMSIIVVGRWAYICPGAELPGLKSRKTDRTHCSSRTGWKSICAPEGQTGHIIKSKDKSLEIKFHQQRDVFLKPSAALFSSSCLMCAGSWHRSTIASFHSRQWAPPAPMLWQLCTHTDPLNTTSVPFLSQKYSCAGFTLTLSQMCSNRDVLVEKTSIPLVFAV